MGLDFLRQAEWLGCRRAVGYLRLLAVLNIAALAFLIVTAHGGIDRNGFLLGSDFLSFWTAGRMLHGAGDVYDAAAHIAAQRGYFAQDGAYTAFFYPPSFLLACWPLGFLPYFPALGLWLAVTGAAFLGTAKAWLRRVGSAWPAWFLFAAFPPVFITITHGQTSFLVAALLGLGALMVRGRPVLAGICFGLATIKPQFGLLVPLVLLLTGEWRVIATAAGTALVLALMATLAFGSDIWAEWRAVSATAQAALEQGAVPYAKMQSAFAGAMLLGAPLWLGYAVQGLVGVGVIGVVVRASWRRRYDLPLAALMLAGAPLVTPFVLDYDMVLLAFPLIWLAARTPRPWERIACAAAFIAPAFARPLAMHFGVPIMPLVLIALFAVLARRVLSKGGGRVVSGCQTPGIVTFE